jgi:hypothetical protein
VSKINNKFNMLTDSAKNVEQYRYFLNEMKILFVSFGPILYIVDLFLIRVANYIFSPAEYFVVSLLGLLLFLENKIGGSIIFYILGIYFFILTLSISLGLASTEWSSIIVGNIFVMIVTFKILLAHKRFG